jgi:hypothetical protein
MFIAYGLGMTGSHGLSKMKTLEGMDVTGSNPGQNT